MEEGPEGRRGGAPLAIRGPASLRPAHAAERLPFSHARYPAADGTPAATNELMLMTIDYATRRSAPWPDFARDRIEKLAAAHKMLPAPKQAGRLIGIKKK